MSDFTRRNQKARPSPLCLPSTPYLSMAPKPFFFIFLSGSSFSSFSFFSLTFSLPFSFFFSFSFGFLIFLALCSASSSSEFPWGADSQFRAPWPEWELLSDRPSVRREKSIRVGQGHSQLVYQEKLNVKYRGMTKTLQSSTLPCGYLYPLKRQLPKSGYFKEGLLLGGGNNWFSQWYERFDTR